MNANIDIFVDMFSLYFNMPEYYFEAALDSHQQFI
jgi:hypothetical protein